VSAVILTISMFINRTKYGKAVGGAEIRLPLVAEGINTNLTIVLPFHVSSFF